MARAWIEVGPLFIGGGGGRGRVEGKSEAWFGSGDAAGGKVIFRAVGGSKSSRAPDSSVEDGRGKRLGTSALACFAPALCFISLMLNSERMQAHLAC